MKTVFSTVGAHPRNSFSRWRQMIFERIVPVELTNLGKRPFLGTLESADIGSIAVTRITQSAIRAEATADTIRRHDKHETITATIVLDGLVTIGPGDRTAVQGAGEIVLSTVGRP